MRKDYFILAVRNLRKRKLRSWLTMIGIIISIATIFVLISLSLGLQNAVQEQFRLLGADKFFIMPKGQLGAPGSGSAVQLTIQDVQTIEKVAGVKAVVYNNIGNAEVIFNDDKRFLMIAGIPLEKDRLRVFQEISAYKPEEGKSLEQGDEGSIMVGSQFKDNNLFKKPVKIGDKIEINGKIFRVKSILKTLGNPSDDQLIYMSIEDFKLLFNSGDRVDQIVIQINQGEDTNLVSQKVEKKLRTFRGVTEKTQDFSILTPDELLESFGVVLAIITGFLLSVAGISLIVGSIGIANTMYTSVLERTREIGLMKAVGAKNSDILYIFLIESGLLGLLGGVLGVILGYCIGKTIEYIAINQLGTTLLQISTPIYLFTGCLIFSFLIGTVSGVLPAYRASHIKTVDALRYE